MARFRALYGQQIDLTLCAYLHRSPCAMTRVQKITKRDYLGFSSSSSSGHPLDRIHLGFHIYVHFILPMCISQPMTKFREGLK
jgi:hypothetical protein